MHDYHSIVFWKKHNNEKLRIINISTGSPWKGLIHKMIIQKANQALTLEIHIKKLGVGWGVCAVNTLLFPTRTSFVQSNGRHFIHKSFIWMEQFQNIVLERSICQC